jgi:hypothetical protein
VQLPGQPAEQEAHQRHPDGGQHDDGGDVEQRRPDVRGDRPSWGHVSNVTSVNPW